MVSNPILFNTQQVLALCGGTFPPVTGFDWNRVRFFQLQNGLMLPFVEDDQPLPGATLRITATRLTIQETDIRKRDVLSVWKEYFETHRQNVGADTMSSFFEHFADFDTSPFRTIGDLEQHTEAQLLHHRNCGPKRLRHIKAMLGSYGIFLRES